MNDFLYYYITPPYWVHGLGCSSDFQTRRLCFSSTASLALEWIPEDGRRGVGRPRRTWQDTLKEDLDTLGVDWSDARDTANDRAR